MAAVPCPTVYPQWRRVHEAGLCCRASLRPLPPPPPPVTAATLHVPQSLHQLAPPPTPPYLSRFAASNRELSPPL
jgi:hypothetical protein